MRRWVQRWQKHVVSIGPGGWHFCEPDEVVETLLGSCVAACVRDTASGIGGMNHVMVPAVPGAGARLTATAYGSYAMETLINEILKRGGDRDRLEVKLFGGGRMLAGMADIGERNITFMREYLVTEGLPLVGEDLGGECPRKVVFSPSTGKVKLRRLRSTLQQVTRRHVTETNLAPIIVHEPELF